MGEKTPHELPEDELARISQYLNDELDVVEKEAFEQRIRTDSNWREKVLEVKALLIGVREANLVEHLAAWQKAVNQDEPTKAGRDVRPLYRRWWVAVASAVVVLMGVWWSWFSSPSDERLYRAYFVADAGLPVAMGGSDTSHYTFYDGMISYKEGNYADALDRWASVEQSTDTIQYFSGLAYMGLGQMASATEQLISVGGDRRSAFYKEANWYLALCYLRKGDRRAAISLLKRIDDDEQAQSLLKKLE